MLSVPQKDPDVDRSQTNFMVLVQNLLKSPSERKRFFTVATSVLITGKMFSCGFYWK